MSAGEHILIIKLGALGDILLAEGAIHDIRLQHPDARITVLTRRAFAPLLSRCPWVDEIMIDKHQPRWRLDAMWQLREQLRQGHFSRIYDLQNSRRSRFYQRVLLGQPDTRSAPKALPVLERHARYLMEAGITPHNTHSPGAAWLCSPADELLIDALLKTHGIGAPFIVLLPGSSARGAAKRWPHYQELAAQLQAHGITPVTVPGPEELGMFSGFAGVELRTDDGRALGLPALAAVLQRASAVVGNDSGPTHLAASLGVPGLALFGTSAEQAARTCMARKNMQIRVAPGFQMLETSQVMSSTHKLCAIHLPDA